ncbi:MAG: hypothetical protein H6591_10475 [Flavobacteriales bacterium]|nr:hypothetical protein [Flavobacteriales bacterium]
MKHLHLLCLGLAVMAACKKDDDKNSPGGGGGNGTGGSASIHIVGYDQPGSFLQACYWKDGVRTNLSDGSSDAVANAIAVTDDHVYVAGYQDFAGSVLNIPVLWVDGTVQPLSAASGPFDAATGVDVFNGEVHVVGSRRHPVSGNDVATHWHNGAEQALTDGSSDAVATGVFADASGVYVSGEMDGKAVYWHDGVLVELTDGTHSAAASDIEVENGVVYVCGGEENDSGILQACSWIDGTKSTLTLNGGMASDLHVVGGNVYVVGRSSITEGDAGYSTYWVNSSSFGTANPPNTIFEFSAGAGIWFDGTKVHTVSGLYGPLSNAAGVYSDNTDGTATAGFGKGATDICVH